MGNESSKGQTKTGIRSAVAGLKGGPSSSTVNRHLDTARKSRVLQLKAANLKHFPEAVREIADLLRNLELSQNRIVDLPAYIGDFTSLKQLHLASNKLTHLPDEIGMLKNVEIINLSDNQLSELPSSFVGCSSLKKLFLSSNKFSVFPVVIAHLQYLETVDLSQNMISELPEEISSLNATELNLNQNRLSDLPDGLASCSRLRMLRVEENCLSKEAFRPQLLKDSSISIISYAGNLFADREFQDLAGYEDYQERYTATRRKM